MLAIIITPTPVVVVDNESTNPDPSADTTPDNSGTNTTITPTKAHLVPVPDAAPLGKQTGIEG